MIKRGLVRYAGTIALTAAMALAGSNVRAWQDDDADVKIGTELVLVNVVATAGSAFANGMTAADFAVAENGVAQKIEFFGTERTPFAAAILLDTSGSMEKKLPLARMAAARFMDRARPTDQVSLYLFGSAVRKLQDFTPGGRDLSDALWDSSAEGITKMNDCIGQACDALKARTEARRAVLLISDGADYGSALSYNDAVRQILANGVTVYSVDLAPIGASPALTSQEAMRARATLHGLADRSGGRFFASKGGGDLNDAFASIVDELTNQYTIGYVPSNLKHDGTWRKISVTTNRPAVKLRAREGYQAPQ